MSQPTRVAPRPTTYPRSERVLLASVLLLALALRVAYVLAMRASPYFADPQVDQRFYVDWGHAIAHGEAIVPGALPRAPLYAWWLAAIFRSFGENLLLVRLLQACIGMLSVALVHSIARRLYGSRAALAAALIAATWWVPIYYEGELLRESLVPFTNLLALLLTLRCAERMNIRRSLGAGLAWGAAALLRPQVLACLPFVLVWLAFRARIQSRSSASTDDEPGARAASSAPVTSRASASSGALATPSSSTPSDAPAASSASAALMATSSSKAPAAHSAPTASDALVASSTPAASSAPSNGRWRSRIAYSALVLAGALLAILPVTFYNLAAVGELVLVSSEGGAALWIGNHPGGDGVTAVVPGIRRDWWGVNADLAAQAEIEAGRKLSPSEVSSHYLHKTLAFFRERPREASSLLLQKLELALADWEFGGNPEEPRFFAERFAPLVRWLPLGFAIVAGLAAAGGVLRRKDGPSRFLMWSYLAAYGATVVLFLASSRHRMPLLHVLAIPAGAGAVALFEAARARRWVRLALGVAIAGLVFGISKAAPAPREASRANGLYWLGVAEARAGRPAEAQAELEEAVRLRPDFAYAQTALSHILRARGDKPRALTVLENALRLAPDDPEALDAATDLLLDSGRTREAREHAERSIAAAPQLARARSNLGRTYATDGDLERAAAAFRAALERDPRYFNAAYSLGAVAEELGRGNEALAAYRLAAAASQAATKEFVLATYERLVALLVERGLRDEAGLHARELVARYPDEQRARAIGQGL